MYATAVDLINAFDANAIIERAAQKKGINLKVNSITPTMVVAVYNQTDVDELTPAQESDCGQIIATLNDALMQGFIEINRYIAARYNTPLTSPYAELMQQTNCQLALHWLYGLFAEQNETVSEAKSYAINYLKDVSVGKVLLGTVGDGTSAPQPKTIIMSHSPYIRWQDGFL